MGHDRDLIWDLFGTFYALGRVWEGCTFWELFGTIGGLRDMFGSFVIWELDGVCMGSVWEYSCFGTLLGYYEFGT
jgi:hypothetical protein